MIIDNCKQTSVCLNRMSAAPFKGEGGYGYLSNSETEYSTDSEYHEEET